MRFIGWEKDCVFSPFLFYNMTKKDEKNKESQDRDLYSVKNYKILLREKRMLYFLRFWYSKLEKRYAISDWRYVVEEGRCRIQTEKYGNVEFYPKANRVHINNENRWISNGLDWILNNLL